MPTASQGLQREKYCSDCLPAHLPTSTLAILGSLNDSWQVEQLNLGSPIPHHSRDTSQRCELVRRHLVQADEDSRPLNGQFEMTVERAERRMMQAEYSDGPDAPES